MLLVNVGSMTGSGIFSYRFCCTLAELKIDCLVIVNKSVRQHQSVACDQALRNKLARANKTEVWKFMKEKQR